MEESLQDIGRRKKMVRALAQQQSLSPRVWQALEKVPRQGFVPQGLQHLAYNDTPLPILAKQTISQPSTVALQTHLLECQKWDKVLEVGTGCGYQTAVLMAMGYKVYSIERIRALFELARSNLAAAGYPISGLNFGDGFKGLPIFAPYNGILVTCAAAQVPQALLDQLAIGGHLVIPVGTEEQRMWRITRRGPSEYVTADFGPYRFVPMLTGTQ